ncbi:TauD/TfdA family dioxygenase [Streptomyces cellulosae]|uniref:TauD/TfdA family dioxygenase n=1 Tax=Streptomyces althioticus TaxID=83380 RepID=A0ABZ1YFV3_9ACTN|nr:TauD/TfdA family dioxygenase [Streptomyces cellulosae]WTB93347.1 TauD/TfdA family dioxygenase [Streptomyces cellulosae]WTC60739.1 TauD/TfdA family dioxygenase [Streptomyces cellulosae]
MPFPQVIDHPPADGNLHVWLQRNSDRVDRALATTGAVLLRGFQVRTAEEFHEAAVVALGPLMPYLEGASPRSPLGGGVYTSTEYAADQVIPLHNELSYSSRWPGRLAFYCKTPATTGGETPIADSRRVYERITITSTQLPPTQVRYLRHMHDGKGPGVGWPTVFDTTDPARVEEHCRRSRIDITWLSDGALRTSQIRPAAIVHPQSGDRVWFNQAHQWHPSNGGPEVEALWRELYGNELPMHATTADGQELPPALLSRIRAAYEAETTTFAWHAGDVLLLDNMLTAHGRTAYTGPREVLVAMGRPVALADVEEVTSHG